MSDAEKWLVKELKEQKKKLKMAKARRKLLLVEW